MLEQKGVHKWVKSFRQETVSGIHPVKEAKQPEPTYISPVSTTVNGYLQQALLDSQWRVGWHTLVIFPIKGA
jgi:hypothetical protein